MLADPNLLMVLTQELTPNDISILGHNAHQPIDILGMLTNQLRQLRHLAFKMF